MMIRLSLRSALMVHKFIRMLKKRIRFNALSSLNLSQVELLNDLSYFRSSDDASSGNRRFFRGTPQVLSLIFVRSSLYQFIAISLKKLHAQLVLALSCIE